VAELVAAVVGCVRLHSVEQRIAAEHLGERRGFDVGFVDAEHFRDLARVSDQPRRRDGGRLDERVERAVHLSQPRPRLGIGGQLAHESGCRSAAHASDRL
jgi:hypothetical protein